MARDFRFGIGLRYVKSATWLRERVRRFEDLGFDVLHVPDHIGAPAPFPTMVAAADAAATMRVGTFVLNAAFYSPALLARDAVATDLLCEVGGAVSEFSAPFVPGVSTHGTGCTYAAAITAGLGKGLALRAAVGEAKEFLARAVTNFLSWERPGGRTDALHHFAR